MNSLSRSIAGSYTDQPCRVCKAPGMPVALRTSYVLYYRCSECGEIWTLPTSPNAAVSMASTPQSG